MNTIRSQSLSDHLNETFKSSKNIEIDNSHKIQNILNYIPYLSEKIDNKLIDGLKNDMIPPAENKVFKISKRRNSTLSKETNIEPNIQLSFLSNDDKKKEVKLTIQQHFNIIKPNKHKLDNNRKNSSKIENRMPVPIPTNKNKNKNKLNHLNKENYPDMSNRKYKPGPNQIESVPLKNITKETNNSLPNNKSIHTSNKSEITSDFKLQERYFFI